VGVVGQRRRPRADGHLHGRHPRGHRRPQAFGDLVAVGAGTVRQQYDELVAAVPGRQVAGFRLLGQRPADLAEHGVASLVAQGVVDVLEVVHVQDHQRHRRAPPVGARDLTFEALLEQPSIRKTGKSVAGGKAFDLGQQPGVAQRERGMGGGLGERVDGQGGDALLAPDPPLGDDDTQ
jgi:hypothetical protein